MQNTDFQISTGNVKQREPDQKIEYEAGAQLFDGEILGRRLNRMLHRASNALMQLEELENHTIEDITVNFSLDAGLNVGFAGIGGEISRSNAFSFTLKRKSK